MSSQSIIHHCLNLQFLERRRSELERYLRRVAAHPALRADPDFRDFLEQPAELPKANEVTRETAVRAVQRKVLSG